MIPRSFDFSLDHHLDADHIDEKHHRRMLDIQPLTATKARDIRRQGSSYWRSLLASPSIVASLVHVTMDTHYNVLSSLSCAVQLARMTIDPSMSPTSFSSLVKVWNQWSHLRSIKMIYPIGVYESGHDKHNITTQLIGIVSTGAICVPSKSPPIPNKSQTKRGLISPELLPLRALSDLTTCVRIPIKAAAPITCINDSDTKSSSPSPPLILYREHLVMPRVAALMGHLHRKSLSSWSLPSVSSSSDEPSTNSASVLSVESSTIATSTVSVSTEVSSSVTSSSLELKPTLSSAAIEMALRSKAPIRWNRQWPQLCADCDSSAWVFPCHAPDCEDQWLKWLADDDAIHEIAIANECHTEKRGTKEYTSSKYPAIQPYCGAHRQMSACTSCHRTYHEQERQRYIYNDTSLLLSQLAAEATPKGERHPPSCSSTYLIPCAKTSCQSSFICHDCITSPLTIKGRCNHKSSPQWVCSSCLPRYNFMCALCDPSSSIVVENIPPTVDTSSPP
jgi:hypothetical protein